MKQLKSPLSTTMTRWNLDFALCKESKTGTILDVDSTAWISDSLSEELGSWIPIDSEIPDSLSCIPDFKAQDSGFHKRQKFAGFRNLLHSMVIRVERFIQKLSLWALPFNGVVQITGYQTGGSKLIKSSEAARYKIFSRGSYKGLTETENRPQKVSGIHGT